MTELTLTERALEYVQKNPGVQTPAVAEELGITRPHAANILTRLERSGLLTSRPIYETGTQRLRQFFPADPAGQARTVAARAQAYGGPFGILMAQVRA